MAASTTTITVNAFPSGVDQTARCHIVRGSIAVGAGGTYVTNGLPIAWTIPENITPNDAFQCHFWATNGFVYVYDPTHVTIRIFVTGTAANDALNEVANLTSLSATTVTFEAWFERAD